MASVTLGLTHNGTDTPRVWQSRATLTRHQNPACVFSPGHGKVIIEEQMWEFVSLAGAHGFSAVEKGVVKSRVAASDAGKLTYSAIREQVKSAIEYLGRLLGK
ncbi:hypothetical protein BDR03DRAFT_563076 [Suillus americanus]|nr:hypothetical protein BDR03DRAFT_563076 [Suillus americanus]